MKLATVAMFIWAVIWCWRALKWKGRFYDLAKLVDIDRGVAALLVDVDAIQALRWSHTPLECYVETSMGVTGKGANPLEAMANAVELYRLTLVAQDTARQVEQARANAIGRAL